MHQALFTLKLHTQDSIEPRGCQQPGTISPKEARSLRVMKFQLSYYYYYGIRWYFLSVEGYSAAWIFESYAYRADVLEYVMHSY